MTRSTRLLAVLLTVALAACATEAPRTVASGSANAQRARANLNSIKANPELAALAPAPLAEAEAAVRTAETYATDDVGLRDHLGYVAEVKVETARSAAEALRADAMTQELVAEQERKRIEAERLRAEAEAARLRAEAQARELEAMQAKKTELGYLLTIGDVLFDSNKSDVKPGAMKKLDPVSSFLVKYADVTIAVNGHTDSTGSDALNQALSERRAEAIKALLVGRGVDAARIKTIGYGETKPVATNKTPAGRQLNRRAEILFDQKP